MFVCFFLFLKTVWSEDNCQKFQVVIKKKMPQLWLFPHEGICRVPSTTFSKIVPVLFFKKISIFMENQYLHEKKDIFLSCLFALNKRVLNVFCLKWVSFRECIVGACFNFIHSANFSLLTCGFRPLIF